MARICFCSLGSWALPRRNVAFGHVRESFKTRQDGYLQNVYELFACFVWIRQIYWIISPWPPFQIHRHKAFRLALQAGIAHGREPILRPAIVFKPPIFLRFMTAFAHVVQNDSRFFVPSHRKTDIIDTTVGRHVRARPGIAHIAEVAQFGFCRGDLIGSCPACSSKTGAQRQTRRKRPAKGNSFGRVKKRTSHNILTVAPVTLRVKINFSLFVNLHTLVGRGTPYESCRAPQSCFHMLDFSNDRAQPPSDACPVPGTKSW